MNSKSRSNWRVSASVFRLRRDLQASDQWLTRCSRGRYPYLTTLKAGLISLYLLIIRDVSEDSYRYRAVRFPMARIPYIVTNIAGVHKLAPPLLCSYAWSAMTIDGYPRRLQIRPSDKTCSAVSSSLSAITWP
jgi:hypothetical protein